MGGWVGWLVLRQAQRAPLPPPPLAKQRSGQEQKHAGSVAAGNKWWFGVLTGPLLKCFSLIQCGKDGLVLETCKLGAVGMLEKISLQVTSGFHFATDDSVLNCSNSTVLIHFTCIMRETQPSMSVQQLLHLVLSQIIDNMQTDRRTPEIDLLLVCLIMRT